MNKQFIISVFFMLIATSISISVLAQKSGFDPQKQKIELEIQSKETELSLKKTEIEKKEKFITPVTATIIIAIIGLLGTIVTNYMQKKAALELEQKKFKYSVYIKVQESENLRQAAEILDFYIDLGIIEGEKNQYSRFLDEGEPERLPIFTSASYTAVKLPQQESGELRIVNHFIIGNNSSYVLSPNHGGKFEEGNLEAIVIHYTATSYPQTFIEALSESATKTSTHIAIDRDGAIVQLVPFNYLAWHAGKSAYDGKIGYNKYSIGIHLVNAGQLVKSGNNYTSWNSEMYSDSEVIEAIHKNEAKPSYWHKYTEKQISVALIICKLLVKTYDIKLVLGSDDISPDRKKDPGPAFPLESFKNRIFN